MEKSRWHRWMSIRWRWKREVDAMMFWPGAFFRRSELLSLRTPVAEHRMVGCFYMSGLWLQGFSTAIDCDLIERVWTIEVSSLHSLMELWSAGRRLFKLLGTGSLLPPPGLSSSSLLQHILSFTIRTAFFLCIVRYYLGNQCTEML